MTWLARLALCFALFFPWLALRADDSALAIGSIVEGELRAGESKRYTLTALALTILSIRVEALDDQLDPQFEFLDASGALVAANDDFAYPATVDAIVQAFVLPKSGAYTLTVAGLGGSAGAYRLHVLPGYDRLAMRDSVMSSQDWEVAHSDAPVGFGAANFLSIDMTGFGAAAVIVGRRFPAQADFYFEVAFDFVSAINGWGLGLAFRIQSPDTYQRLLLNKNGYWRMERVSGGFVEPLDDWATHPAIVPGASKFRLGLLVAGAHIDIVYEGQVIDSVWGARTTEAGGVGIAMLTDAARGGLMSFAVLEAQMTVPTRLEAPIIPQRIKMRAPYLLAHDLSRQQLAQGFGETKLSLSESSVRNNRAGVTRVPIASGLAFGQFALGAKVRLERRAEGNGGCGIIFHFYNDENYTLAYFTADGDYGLSRRAGAGFAPGVYGHREAPPDSMRQLLLLVNDEVIHFYLDEVYVGSLPSQRRFGNLGIAVVNYQAIQSACQFADLWLLSYDD
ncbi:MAG: hypothetical protein OXG92_02450 [Chloroflexi bacterium]|nr:hypothetical protein [Chloroflexota bacterium]MCY3582069.1 hypothetical protein [Chloroflexota bacterium]MCY3715314.1 hypothetical protein [Chloroflexota bacterium]MDE2649523.1 hypothetical protein [Chloroflexota bacterium]MXX84231.1 hypothetical protein [Chloroflexota bacterium]